jgi:hypothetical protein
MLSSGRKPDRRIIMQKYRTRKVTRLVLLATCCLFTFLTQCGKKDAKAGSETTTIQVKGSDTMVNVAQAWVRSILLLTKVLKWKCPAADPELVSVLWLKVQ